MRISDWSSDVCSSDLLHPCRRTAEPQPVGGEPPDLGPRGPPEGAPLPPPCPRPPPYRAARVAVPPGPRGVRRARDDRGPAPRAHGSPQGAPENHHDRGLRTSLPGPPNQCTIRTLCLNPTHHT